MNRKHLQGALLIAGASLLTSVAYAENPQAAPAPAKAAAEKAGDKAEKAADKAEKAADKAVDKAKSLEDRVARKAKERDAQRQKLQAVMKTPMDDGVRAELKRNAERVARLERIKAVAHAEKDTATVEKTTALIGKENDRHDRWMTKHLATATAPGAMAPAVPIVPGATPPPAADPKGGAR